MQAMETSGAIFLAVCDELGWGECVRDFWTIEDRGRGSEGP